jgi:Virulence protein RhuM family
MENNVEIYQSDDGALQLSVPLQQDTVWLNQAQMAELFGTQRPAITKHLGNIFKSGELAVDSVCSNLEHTAADGKTYKTQFYSLDAIISVGYRVNSVSATRFRQWATKTLKQHLLQGYTLNQQRFEKNAVALEQALKLIQKTAQSPELNLESGRGLVDIVSRYTQTFLWLQRYDEGLLDEPEGQQGGVLPTPEVAMQSLQALKKQLLTRGEATDLFARPRDAGLAGIFGNLDQSVFGEPAYPTVESKAAHLRNFVVMYRMYGMQRAHGRA